MLCCGSQPTGHVQNCTAFLRDEIKQYLHEILRSFMHVLCGTMPIAEIVEFTSATALAATPRKHQTVIVRVEAFNVIFPRIGHRFSPSRHSPTFCQMTALLS